MRCFVTGCAGFIGSHLVDYLLKEGHQVVGYDNCSTGRLVFLQYADQSTNFQFIQGDLLDYPMLVASMPLNFDMVFHLAANADVRFGADCPDKDFQQNTQATLNVLAAMREKKVKRIVFTSTASVYGEATQFPIPENAAFPLQTSLYGASKLAAEGFIHAYCEAFDMQSYIFRLVSVLGERYTHGHVFDFYQQLVKNKNTLYVLGNGLQRKSYLYIDDCIKGIYWAIHKANNKINVFNLGTNEYCTVNDSIAWICSILQCSPTLYYAGGERGWVGDNSFIWVDIDRMCQLGWAPQLTIRDSVMQTVKFLQENTWLMQKQPTLGTRDTALI